MNLDDLFNIPAEVAAAPVQIPDISYCDYDGKELYALAKNNKVQMWKAEVIQDPTPEGFYIVRATYGFTDGAKQTKDTLVKKGTNIGKKNEKTVIEQAYIKLEQMYEDKIKKKSMVWDIADWVTPKRPMLATAYKKRVKQLAHVKQWLIDRKLDGNRAYTYFDGSVQSKSGEAITPLSHIFAEHQRTFAKAGHHLYGPIELDGEYYLHGVPLEDISSIVGTENDAERSTDILLKYHVYDAFFPEHTELTALQRYNALQDLFADCVLEYHVLSEKELIDNKYEAIEEIAKRYVEEGYEGAILRDVDGVYMHSKNISDRNDVMIKFKFMEDDEFFIVDIIENEQEPGLPKFIIDLRNGNTCEVVMSGKKNDAKHYLTNKNMYINKAWIKVQYQSWTKYGRLSFPVGLEIREGSVDADGNFDPKY